MNEGIRQGGCRCGKVRFEVRGEPMLTVACHCRGCQRMTASAFSLSEAYHPSQLRLTEGEVVTGGIHGPSRHRHCDYCKSWLYTEPEGIPDLVNVRSTMFDEVNKEPPFVETFLAEALPWVQTGTPHGYRKFPAMEEWPSLIDEYRSRNKACAKEESCP